MCESRTGFRNTKRSFLGHLPYAGRLVSCLDVPGHKLSLPPPHVPDVETEAETLPPARPAPGKDMGPCAALPLLGWWEAGRPQTPGPGPRWSFLYSHHGLSVALMKRPRCGADELLKATSSQRLPPKDGTSC